MLSYSETGTLLYLVGSRNRAPLRSGVPGGRAGIQRELHGVPTQDSMKVNLGRVLPYIIPYITPFKEFGL